MKKIISTVLIALGLFLTGCQKKSESIVISKLITATSLEDNVIELYNNSTKDISLKNYSINIFSNGSLEPTNKIKLPGIIKANDYFIISGKNFNKELLTTAVNYVHDSNLSFNGDDAIALVKNNKIVDLVGYVGHDLNFSKDLTLIRLGYLESYEPSDTYDRFIFITYAKDMFKYIGNDDHEIKTMEQLLDGPKLEDRYLSLDYQIDNIGTGGIVNTTWNKYSNADGDTAVFNPSGLFTGGSYRYYYIDTPEVQSNYVNAEPFGYVASKFNKEYLLTKEPIILQSIPGTKVTETFNRSLGLVWTGNQLSQHLIVREGLSVEVPTTFTDADLSLTYRDVPYLTFLQYAEENARVNKWGLFGEKSPDWNYQDNTVLTTSPEWIPKVSW